MEKCFCYITTNQVVNFFKNVNTKKYYEKRNNKTATAAIAAIARVSGTFVLFVAGHASKKERERDRTQQKTCFIIYTHAF
jgi:hypothetical protein